MIPFLWQSSRGYRLRPWASPYLRWRIETFWGLEANSITPADFRRFLWKHRRELWRFLRWASKMRTGSAGGRTFDPPAV